MAPPPSPSAMPAPPSQQSRPKLKISVSHSKLPTTTQGTTTPSGATPMTTPGGRKKIVIKGPSQPQTPADGSIPQIQVPQSAKTKAGRQTKPTAKKREHDELGDDSMLETAQPAPKKAKHIKILSVNTPNTPKDGKQIVIKHKGKAPIRPLGDGYDSEASDKEEDPHIEEQIIFRMMPGEDADFLRKAVSENTLDTGKHNPGFSIVWFEEETRRAAVTVRGQLYAAVLLDLPTITEGMKTWDKKNIMKSADISQMLLVFQKVATLEEARKAPLPAAVEPPFKWPHGLTPPMHDCVHRRFAKVISRKEIEDKEAEVERLLRLDREAKSTRFEFLDDRAAKTPADGVEYEEDADGEEDDSYFPQASVDTSVADLNLEADLEAAFEASTASPATQLEGITPMTANATPATGIRETVEEDEDSGDDDDDDDEDMDEEEQARMDEVKGVRSMIADLKAQLKAKEAELQKPNIAQSMILKRRVEESIRALKSEIQLKMSSIGEEEEEEE